MRKSALFLFLSISGFISQAQENFNMQLRSHLPFPGKTCANIWGYANDSNDEFALVGTSTGMSIVDVTNPDSPELLFEVPSVQNFWREVKTWEGFAYMTTEGDGAGLVVVDLRSLPDTIYYQTYFGDGAIENQLSTIHALHIDNGRCYLYGSNIGNGGALILDLADPWNPTYLGQYDTYYVHDGYVEGDTAWFGNIYNGFFTVVDVSNPAAPVELTLQETPGNFTHNTWLTDNNQYLLTTDEISNSYLASYKIDAIGNIQEVDRFQTAPGSNCIVHNTHVLNDYAVTSWYTEGVVVVDADRADNLVEVARYDFSDFEGDGFHGCWGVYPYLPSGNIIASDIETALWVLTPEYKRGCYLEGSITDSTCGTPISDATITISPSIASDVSNNNGIFKLGTVTEGVFTVTISKPGYETLTFENLQFTNGNLIELNVTMYSNAISGINGSVVNANNEGLPSAQVNVSDATNSYNFTTDNQGEYTRCDLLPGTYTVVAGEWGFITECTENVDVQGGGSTVSTTLNVGYMDDFQFNFGWSSSSTSAAGLWERAVPVATTINGDLSNANADVSGDCNGFAYVTGNSAGTGAGSDDIDDGCSKLFSPIMDLSGYESPYINLYYWFFNGGGNSTGNDTLYLKLEQNSTEYVVSKFTLNNSALSQWVPFNFPVKDFIETPSQVRFIIEACDIAPGHLVEAGLDQFLVIDSATVGINDYKNNQTFVFPNPGKGSAWIQAKSPIHSVAICDLSGRTIKQLNGQNSSTMIELPAIDVQGMYLIRVSLNNGITETLRWINQ
jgi:choice-of-anchor B domain-containing protein